MPQHLDLSRRRPFSYHRLTSNNIADSNQIVHPLTISEESSSNLRGSILLLDKLLCPLELLKGFQLSHSTPSPYNSLTGDYICNILLIIYSFNVSPAHLLNDNGPLNTGFVLSGGNSSANDRLTNNHIRQHENEIFHSKVSSPACLDLGGTPDLTKFHGLFRSQHSAYSRLTHNNIGLGQHIFIHGNESSEGGLNLHRGIIVLDELKLSPELFALTLHTPYALKQKDSTKSFHECQEVCSVET